MNLAALARAASAPPERPRIQRATHLTMVARAASDTLPAGVIGQVEGIALVYDVIDTYGTTFAKGCLDRTVRERVKAGKVRLFLDHGDSPITGMYDTHLHIGTVRSVRDTTLPDGTMGAVFSADIFDTEPGRKAHEYLRAVAATGSETGISIGMMFMPETSRAVVNGQTCERISEVPLGEVSITAMSSVPGTRMTAVRFQRENSRHGPDGDTLHFPDAWQLFRDQVAAAIHEKNDEALMALLDRAQTDGLSGDAPKPTDSDAAPNVADSDAASGDSQPAPSEGARTDLVATDARLAWCRAAFQRLYN